MFIPRSLSSSLSDWLAVVLFPRLSPLAKVISFSRHDSRLVPKFLVYIYFILFRRGTSSLSFIDEGMRGIFFYGHLSVCLLGFSPGRKGTPYFSALPCVGVFYMCNQSNVSDIHFRARKFQGKCNGRGEVSVLRSPVYPCIYLRSS